MLQEIPDPWGPKLELERGAVAHTRTGPDAIRMRADAHFVLILLSTQTTRHVALNSDRAMVGLAPAGSVELMPVASDLTARWEAPKETILAGLTVERLRTLAGAEFGTDGFELYPPRLGLVDAQALAIGRAIRDEMRCGEFAVHECVDAWLTILGTHLLRRYSSLGGRPDAGMRKGLSPSAWRKVDDYIRAHIANRITIEQLAETAQLSPSHFARSFRAMTGQAPYQYILALRMEAARQRILEDKEPLEKVARLTGFSSHSHMTATMRRFWGVSPTAIRRGRSESG